MMKFKFVFVSAVMVLGLMVVACGETETVEVIKEVVVEKEVPGKAYVTDPITGMAIAAPEYGGSLAFAGRNTWDRRLDPYTGGPSMSAITSGVMEKPAMVDWMIDRDSYSFGGYPPPVSAMTGSLAESWDVSNGGKTITLNVRSGVNFHDKAPVNGREMTADDFVHSYQRMLGSKLTGSEFSDAEPSTGTGSLGGLAWDTVTGDVDTGTVTLNLTEPSFFALRFILDWYSMVIVPREMVETYGNDWDWDKTVGTGPYTITASAPGVGMTYTKNPNYYRHDEKFPDNRLPYIDEVKGVEITERASWLAGLRTGKIDYIGWQGVTHLNNVDEKESLERTNPELVIRSWSERSEASHIFNIKRPPFDDVNVRRAMQMALDLETINATYFKYSADITPRGRIATDAIGYHVPFEEWSDEHKGYYTYDPEGAEKLLDSAGLPRGSNGMRFKAEFIMSESADASLAEIHAEYWKAIGADIKIVPVPGAEWGARRSAFDWDLHGWIAGVKGDPVWQSSYLYSGRSNYIEDAEYDGYYEGLLVSTSDAQRMDLVKKADMRIIDQHWVVWGGDESKYSVWQPYMVGYNLERGFGGGQNYVVFSRLWIDSALKAQMGR